MISEIILILVVAAGAYYYLNRKKWKLPPGPVGIPGVGNFLGTLGKGQHIVHSYYRKKYGDIYHLKIGSTTMVILGNVQFIKDCYNDPTFNGRPADMLFCILSQGQHGIISSEGQEWTEQRRFTLRHLRDFGFGKNSMENLIMDEVNDFNSYLKSEEGKSVFMNAQKFELPVLNALWMIITGKKFMHDDAEKLGLLKKLDDFVRPSIAGLLNLLAPALVRMAPELTGWSHFERTSVQIRTMLKEIIKEHEETLSEEGNPRDFIDAYLHEIKKTSDPGSSFYKEDGVRSLIAVIGDMFFAGAETSSATLTWSILYLAVNPDIQKKLQDQIDEVVGKSRQVTLADRSNLPYAEATLQEIFRKSSLVTTGLMHTTTKDTTFAGYDIPKGTWVMPNIYAIHHDENIWGDPENFRPERFLSSDGKKVIKSENLLPFSLGRRICLGENLARDEIFLFLTNIFQRFSITVDPGQPKPTHEPKLGALLHPKDFHIIVQERL